VRHLETSNSSRVPPPQKKLTTRGMCTSPDSAHECGSIELYLVLDRLSLSLSQMRGRAARGRTLRLFEI